MRDSLTHVLLVEEDSTDSKRIEEARDSVDGGALRKYAVDCLSDALKRLRQNTFEVSLLDLTVPDSQDRRAVDNAGAAAHNAAILVLNEAHDKPILGQVVLRGGRACFASGQHNDHWLARAFRYAIECRATRDTPRSSEASFRAMSDASPLGIFVSDAQGRCVYTNAAYQKISGLSFEQALGMSWSAFIHPDDTERVLAQWHDAARNHEPFQAEYRFLRKNGGVVWTRVNSAAMPDGLESYGYVQTVEDVTERKSTEADLRAAEEALFDEKERAQVTLNSIGDAVLTTDLQGKLTYLNLVAERMTGWSCKEALQRPLSEVFNIIDGNSRQAASSPAQRAIDGNKTVGLAADCVLIRRDGCEFAIEDSAAPIHNRDGQVTGAVIVFHDVSQSRELAQQMRHLAQHDPLTGLPNRALLVERTSQAMALARRHRKKVGLLYVDLDYFKHVNDSLGHTVGDQLLKSVANHLSGSVRATDTVCRQGGDEFVILLAEIEQPQDAAYVAGTLCAGFAPPHIIGEHELHVTLSIGISVYPEDGTDVDTLLQNADIAMYHVKENGRKHYQFYREEMHTVARRRMLLQNKLRHALKEHEFLVYYQPKVSLNSGEITGIEALIRWRSPELGLVYPKQFVPIAEECGLIMPIGLWVLNQACSQVQNWIAAGREAVPVSVNISAEQFIHQDFPEAVALVLRETGLSACYLELEITEGTLMHDTDASVTALDALRALGVRLAIDDFGTGYAGLTYLRRFPINTLKIGQSFVRDITIDADAAKIVSAVIGMGKSLKQQVVAEGIETREQLTFLRKNGCDTGQGFYFSHPLTAEDCGRLLSSNATLLEDKA